MDDIARLEQEIVLGHVDYRKVSLRSIQFRRCFGEFFRNCSFFFLGSGLSEPYFRSIFDEVIELVGPPVRQHFALIEDGSVDADLLEQQYHILCNSYPKNQHSDVTTVLNDLGSTISSSRARLTKWGFRMSASGKAERIDANEHFCVVRAPLPDPKLIGHNEVLAISCGRASTDDEIGRPLVSSQGFDLIHGCQEFSWCSKAHWNVKWTKFDNIFGIVARDKNTPGEAHESSRDRRNPNAIRIAFFDFLINMDVLGVEVAHVQLLAAGESRVWAPWVSLVQMARAYGQWIKTKRYVDDDRKLRINVHVVDPSLIHLIQIGGLDLRPEIECTRFHIRIESIDALGGVSINHRFVSSEDIISNILAKFPMYLNPTVTVYPKPRLSRPVYDGKRSVGELGLVSGSVLKVDFRACLTMRSADSLS